MRNKVHIHRRTDTSVGDKQGLNTLGRCRWLDTGGFNQRRGRQSHGQYKHSTGKHRNKKYHDCNPHLSLFRYYENRTGERFSALDSRLNSISMEIDTISSSINATVSHVQSMYKYINIESSSCQGRMGRHTEDLQVENRVLSMTTHNTCCLRAEASTGRDYIFKWFLVYHCHKAAFCQNRPFYRLNPTLDVFCLMSHVLLKLNLERELSELNKEKLAIASFELNCYFSCS